jgi:hypothetical protein
MTNGTSTLEREPVGMSVAGRNLYRDEEVEIMTTVSALEHLIESPAGSRARPHGIDRLVMRLSLAMLVWARRRSEKSIITRDEHAILFAQQRGLETRELEWNRLAERRF